MENLRGMASSSIQREIDMKELFVKISEQVLDNKYTLMVVFILVIIMEIKGIKKELLNFQMVICMKEDF